MTSDAFTALDLHHAATTIADVINERTAKLDHGYSSCEPDDVLAALHTLGMTLTPDPDVNGTARHAANTP